MAVMVTITTVCSFSHHQIGRFCHLEELELRFVGEHLSVVGVKSQQLPLDVRQGAALHHALGDVLVRAVVVSTVQLKHNGSQPFMWRHSIGRLPQLLRRVIIHQCLI